MGLDACPERPEGAAGFSPLVQRPSVSAGSKSAVLLINSMLAASANASSTQLDCVGYGRFCKCCLFVQSLLECFKSVHEAKIPDQ